MCPTVESPSFMKCIKCVSQLHKVSSPVYLTCSPFTQRQADVSSVVIQLCRFDLAAVSRPTLHRPPRLSSPSSRISVQRESCLHTITQVIILCSLFMSSLQNIYHAHHELQVFLFIFAWFYLKIGSYTTD